MGRTGRARVSGLVKLGNFDAFGVKSAQFKLALNGQNTVLGTCTINMTLINHGVADISLLCSCSLAFLFNAAGPIFLQAKQDGRGHSMWFFLPICFPIPIPFLLPFSISFLPSRANELELLYPSIAFNQMSPDPL